MNKINLKHSKERLGKRAVGSRHAYLISALAKQEKNKGEVVAELLGPDISHQQNE
jgi:hypothetical protein